MDFIISPSPRFPGPLFGLIVSLTELCHTLFQLQYHIPEAVQHRVVAFELLFNVKEALIYFRPARHLLLQHFYFILLTFCELEKNIPLEDRFGA